MMRKRLTLLLLILLLSFSHRPAYAEGTEMKTEEEAEINGEEIIKEDPLPAYEGSVQVVYGISFSDGSFDTWATTSGVLVNPGTAICTDMREEDFTDTIEDRRMGYEALGIIPSASDLVFRIYDGKDLKEVEDIKSDKTADGEDILILTIADALTDDEGNERKVRLSPGGELDDRELSVTGYTEMKPNLYVSDEELLIQTIRVTEEGENEFSFSSSAQFDFKSSAVINGYNEICGFVTEEGKAVRADALKEILDRNGVYFETESPAYMVDRSQLVSLLGMEPEKDLYTEESYAAYEEKREKAEEVLRKDVITQEEIDRAVEELSDAYSRLEEAPHIPGSIVVSLIAFSGTVLFSLMFFYIIRKRRHKYRKEDKGKVVDGGIFDDIVPEREKEDEQENRERRQAGKKDCPAMLIREDTGEKIGIEKNHFVMGRSPSCDYCMENDSISKEHIRISLIGGIYHITDLGSTNHTYLNGSILPKQVPTIIRNGDRIAVSNLIFEFRNRDERETEPDSIEECTGVLRKTDGRAGLIWRGIRHEVSPSPFSIGRSRHASLKISDDINVSREHAIITEESGGMFSIYDNNATNATRLNGYRIEPMKKYILEDGAVIQIVNEVLTFRMQETGNA